MNDEGKKRVTFAEDVKRSATPAATETIAPEEVIEKTDGIVGQLEIYQSGAVKMRLNNGLVLDARFPFFVGSILMTYFTSLDSCGNTTILFTTRSTSRHEEQTTEHYWRGESTIRSFP